MAYTMIHIIIAEEIFSKFSLNINENDFLIGTIAPDAVHSCEEFSYKLKEKKSFFSRKFNLGKGRYMYQGKSMDGFRVGVL